MSSSNDRNNEPVEPVDATSTISIPALYVDAEELTADQVSATDGLPAGSALLLVQRGPSAGARFLLDTDSVTVGRHPDSDIFLDDITVSRRHATFTRTANGHIVADLGSLNGTYVNRDRIEGDITLAGGDEVQIGKYRLMYITGPVGAKT
ncbi:MAG: FHA domain-containing protein [Kineosporiaceae bacterium]|nr:FHA domain-containing protein [Aeromicrobium sp.]